MSENTDPKVEKLIADAWTEVSRGYVAEMSEIDHTPELQGMDIDGNYTINTPLGKIPFDSFVPLRDADQDITKWECLYKGKKFTIYND